MKVMRVIAKKVITIGNAQHVVVMLRHLRRVTTETTKVMNRSRNEQGQSRLTLRWQLTEILAKKIFFGNFIF